MVQCAVAGGETIQDSFDFLLWDVANVLLYR